MEKIKYTIRYNRKKQLNKNGLGAIQIECYLQGKRKFFDTKIKVAPEHWNEKTKTIKGTPNAPQQNKLISELIRALENYELRFLNEGKAFNLSMLENVFNSDKNQTFNEFIKNELISNIRLKNGSKETYITTLKHLNNFNKNTAFSDINYEFLQRFERYLKSIKTHLKKPLSINSIALHLNVLKIFVNLAINKDLININDNPFRKYKIQKQKKERAFLTPSEIDKIENIQPENKLLQYVKDLYLFSVYTGLRYSDIFTLKKNNIVVIDGKEWIIKDMEKTSDKIKIPIYLLFNGKPSEIIRKYWLFGRPECFKYIGNSYLNKQIKLLFALANIEKHGTFHTARHTTATYLLSKGVSIFVVQNILGHKNIYTTQIYSHILNDTLVNELEAVNF